MRPTDRDELPRTLYSIDDRLIDPPTHPLQPNPKGGFADEIIRPPIGEGGGAYDDIGVASRKEKGGAGRCFSRYLPIT
jgi:hypothetical protein